jgi:hypothetical protein
MVTKYQDHTITLTIVTSVAKYHIDITLVTHILVTKYRDNISLITNISLSIIQHILSHQHHGH